ncbi:MAG: hypothetical protein R8G34_23005 [Paracoccaceae bacterium]|nr:hypothetical protein [Paracoccaceae bacterium]
MTAFLPFQHIADRRIIALQENVTSERQNNKTTKSSEPQIPSGGFLVDLAKNVGVCGVNGGLKCCFVASNVATYP